MGRFWSGISALALAGAMPGVVVAQVVLDGGGVTLRAPAALDCAALPVIAVEGGIAAALAGDRAALADVVSRMSLGIASACPAAEALRFEGTERGVTIGFRTTRAEGWQMPGAAAPAPAAATALAPETPVAATTPAADPAVAPAAPPVAAEPAPAPIAPGVAFADLAAFYGGLPTVRGHAALDRSDTWTRTMAARAYAERPDIIAEDAVALEIAQAMLNPAEFQQFLGALAPQVQRGFQSLSVFDRRDLAERVRSQIRPYLDQRRQTGPIDVYHAIPVRLGEYSFDRGAFPFNGTPSRNHPEPAWRGYGLTRLLDGVVLPTELRTTADEARQIDAYLRTRRDPTVYLGVFLSVDPRAPDTVAQTNVYTSGQATRPPVALRQVALFVDADLTQMLFDYTPVLADQQARVAALQGELSRSVASGEAMVRAVAALSGGTTRVDETVAAMAQQLAQYESTDPAAAEVAVRSAFDRANAQPRMRMSGYFNISDTFDPRLGGLPVQSFSLQAPQFASGPLQSRVDLTVFPSISVLPVPEETARTIVDALRRNGVEVLVDGDLLQGVQQPVTDGYVQISATFAPRRVLVVSGGSGTPVAERTLLADVTLPEAPALPVTTIPTLGTPIQSK
ncbi:MAG: hypothetical protein MUF73_17475 [Rhodobacteraceae bacterium]|jgi:hypothetical protein|nr:hypothetical protein [Paracoccaceae bacterium]